LVIQPVVSAILFQSTFPGVDPDWFSQTAYPPGAYPNFQQRLCEDHVDFFRDRAYDVDGGLGEKSAPFCLGQPARAFPSG
jgi:hypothetical protein